MSNLRSRLLDLRFLALFRGRGPHSWSESRVSRRESRSDDFSQGSKALRANTWVSWSQVSTAPGRVSPWHSPSPRAALGPRSQGAYTPQRILWQANAQLDEQATAHCACSSDTSWPTKALAPHP